MVHGAEAVPLGSLGLLSLPVQSGVYCGLGEDEDQVGAASRESSVDGGTWSMWH